MLGMSGHWAVPVIIVIFAIGLISFTVSDAWAQTPPPSPPLVGDFKCYTLFPSAFVSIVVELADQFEIETHTASFAPELCSNVIKSNSTTGAVLSNSPVHINQTYIVYNIDDVFVDPDDIEDVILTDQFGTFEAQVFNAFELWVPANKTHLAMDHDATQDFHWKCYNIANTTNVSFPQFLNLTDQFDDAEHEIFQPFELCNPVEKTPVSPPGPTFGNALIQDHMICYNIFGPGTFDFSLITTMDQFLTFNPELAVESKLCTVASKVIISGLGPVGGESLPINPVSLLVAGFQVNSIWMIPTVLGIVGAAIAVYKLKRK